MFLRWRNVVLVFDALVKREGWIRDDTKVTMASSALDAVDGEEEVTSGFDGRFWDHQDKIYTFTVLGKKITEFMRVYSSSGILAQHLSRSHVCAQSFICIFRCTRCNSASVHSSQCF